jgi:nucleoside-diphosphate-sugar epimerase
MEKQLGDARKTSADTSKAQSDLGFKPSVSLEDGIAREIAWMKEIVSA